MNAEAKRGSSGKFKCEKCFFFSFSTLLFFLVFNASILVFFEMRNELLLHAVWCESPAKVGEGGGEGKYRVVSKSKILR